MDGKYLTQFPSFIAKTTLLIKPYSGNLFSRHVKCFSNPFLNEDWSQFRQPRWIDFFFPKWKSANKHNFTNLLSDALIKQSFTGVHGSLSQIEADCKTRPLFFPA